MSRKELLRDLELTQKRGYAVDDQENEIGINCVALPIFLDGSAEPVGAVSINAVAFRCPLNRLVRAVPEVRVMIQRHLGARALG